MTTYYTYDPTIRELLERLRRIYGYNVTMADAVAIAGRQGVAIVNGRVPEAARADFMHSLWCLGSRRATQRG